MQISISQCDALLTAYFTQNKYSLPVAKTMSQALIRSELFHKKTHGVSRAQWIVTKNISKSTQIQTLVDSENISIIDCLGSNGYYCAQKEIEKIIKNGHDFEFHISVLKNIFPTNALIDYLEQFHQQKLGAIIMTTTPYLVGVRGNGNKILGTNPFGYTFPNDITTIIADMSTSNIAFGHLLNNYKNIQEKNVLNASGELDFPKNIFRNNIFSGALLPFGGEKGEHKGFIIGFFIELLTAAFLGNRSNNGDMIIISFSEGGKFYQKSGINEVIQRFCEKNIRIPGQNSYFNSIKNRENNSLDIDDTFQEFFAKIL